MKALKDPTYILGHGNFKAHVGSMKHFKGHNFKTSLNFI